MAVGPEEEESIMAGRWHGAGERLRTCFCSPKQEADSRKPK